MSHPNGTRIDLAHGAYRASIASVGSTLRALEFDGHPLVTTFAVDELRPLYRGALLAPWPNRVVDGRYEFGGLERRLPINEHARGHALHGLVDWLDFDVVSAGSSQARLRGVVTARAGYPFTVAIDTWFALTEAGLVTTVTATNISADVAPYGVAAHPYLVAGTASIDQAWLQVPATQFLEATGERLLPGQVRQVAEADDGVLDFRRSRPIGPTEIDHAYTGLEPAQDGTCTVRLTDSAGAGAFMRWNGQELPWLQVHTADRPEPHWNRRGLAVEPMTCPPDAFNSGIDLIRLEPGASHTVSWTIGALSA